MDKSVELPTYTKSQEGWVIGNVIFQMGIPFMVDVGDVGVLPAREGKRVSCCPGGMMLSKLGCETA